MLGLPVLTFLIFLVLQLADVINWSWWWVTSPLWISAICAGILLFAFRKFIMNILKEAGFRR